MKTIAVIVTYNRKAKLLACLKALAEQTTSSEILVVDNASTDGTNEIFSSDIPHSSFLIPHSLAYLNTGANLGGAGGFAFGIREARFGLPIAEFFIWCDDLEWTRHVSRQRPCFVVPSSVVIHDIAGTAASDLATDVPERIPRYFYAFRNEFYTYRREGLRGIAYYFAKCAKHLMRVLIRAPDCRCERLSALLRSVRAGLSFHPKRERLMKAYRKQLLQDFRERKL